MRLSLKLLPLAAIFAAGVLLATLPASTTPVSATPVSLTVNGTTGTTSGALNSAVPVIAIYSDEGTAMTLFSTASATIGYFVSPSITANNKAQAITPNGNPAISITVADDADLNPDSTTVSALFLCVSPGSATIYFQQAGITSNQVVLNCGGTGTGTGVGTLVASPALIQQGTQGQYAATNFSVNIGSYVTLTASPAYVTFQTPSILTSTFQTGEQAIGIGTTSLYFTTTSAGSRTMTGAFTCIQQGTFVLTLNVSGIGTVQSNQIICGTGILTPTAVTAPKVTVAAAPTSVNCNGASLIAASVKDQFTNVPVANGTTVVFSASSGSVSPSTATTSNGEAGAVFNAPSTNGTISITASAAGQTGSTTISVSCATAATPTPFTPPPVVIPQVTFPSTISPPNTGDAGLAGGGTSWSLYAGIVLIAASALAAGGLVRVRA